METENQERERKKAKDGTSTRIIKAGILEYNMTGMLTDKRRYGNSETKGNGTIKISKGEADKQTR